MSFAHFDEINEIILDLMEEEEVLLKEMHSNERLEAVKNLIPYDDHRWWEEAVNELINEKEKEKEGLYV